MSSMDRIISFLIGLVIVVIYAWAWVMILAAAVYTFLLLKNLYADLCESRIFRTVKGAFALVYRDLASLVSRV